MVERALRAELGRVLVEGDDLQQDISHGPISFLSALSNICIDKQLHWFL